MSLYNKARHRPSNVTTRVLAKPLLPWKSSTYYISGFVLVASVILHAKSMRCIISLSVVSSPPYMITNYLMNGTIYRGGETLFGIKCFFLRVVEIFLILRRIYQDAIITVHKSPRKVLIFLVTFCWNLNILYRLLQYFQALFGCTRTLAKNAYYLRHVRLAVYPSACNRATPIGRVSVKFDTVWLLRKSVEELQIWLKVEQKIPKWRHKFAIQTFLCSTQ